MHLALAFDLTDHSFRLFCFLQAGLDVPKEGKHQASGESLAVWQ